MIIKKWSGSAWAEQYPKTTIADIFLANGTTEAFAGGKISADLLPNSVFDSLKFYGTTTGNVAAAPARTTLAGALIAAKNDAATAKRDVVGFYFVVSTGGTISDVTGIQDTVGGTNEYATLQFRPTDMGSNATPSASSGSLEVGDWFVIESVTGAGTIGSPWVFVAAVISNTYDIATATAAGVIELFSNTQQSTAANAVTNTALRTYGIQLNSDNQAVVNVPWVDTNTTYTSGVGLTLSGTTFAADLIDMTLRAVTAEAITTTASRTYAVMPDADGDLVVNVPWVDTNTTYTAGAGLTLTGTAFSHTDTSSAATLTASGRTYVTGLTFDTYGHVTGYTTAAETVVDTNTTYSAGNGIALSGTTFSVAGGEGLTQEASGLKMTYPVYWATTLPTSGITTGSIGFEG